MRIELFGPHPFDTKAPAASVALTGPSGAQALQGQGRFWGGVVSGDPTGEWEIEAGAGLRSVSVYHRPRYAWYLSVPASWSGGATSEPPLAHLYLCRRGGSECSTGQGDFRDLPATIPGSFVDADGRTHAISFARGPDRGEPPPAYVASLPPGRVGEVRLTVDPGAFATAGLPTAGVLDATFTLRYEVPLTLADWQGVPVGGVKVEEAPRIPGWIGRLAGGLP